MGLLTYASLCLFGFLLSGPFPGAEADSCPRNWLQTPGNCYAYFDTKMTWAEAEIECQTYGRGTHLASLLSPTESDLIANHISSYQKEKSNVWIGLHDPRQNHRWRWTDESVYGYNSWYKYKSKNGSNNEYCVELLLNSDFKEWNDVSCRARNSFICKYER
ncbi:C-type lectin-like [Anolis sagrei]|uniref:C-type lectin-like n=1 Tax=Anolis sagrei TaxID=38937 RepID=UPI0035223CCB